MRASLYLVGFAAASLLGAGIFEIGCSSSSSPAAAGGTDAATDATGDDVGDDGGGPPCTAAPVNVATFDAGSPVWACLQAACAPSLGACGTDCVCNDAFLAALECQADGGSPTTCFGTASSVDTAAGTAVTCLATKTGGCGLSIDAGPDSGTATDSGTAADTGTVADTGTTTDASDGGVEQ
jgi:hypothetical protein